MFEIDKDTKWIYMTRGDSETIVFSAKDPEGEPFVPTAHDKLIFSAAKKWGDDPPLLRIENTMVDDAEDFWTVIFEPEHTKDLEFKKYCYDVQIELRSSDDQEDPDDVITIIGKTETLSPTLVIWGEVS